MMKEITAERAVETKDKGRRRAACPVTVLTVVLVDEDGDALCRPAAWAPDAETPRIELDPDSVRGPSPKPGDQYLAGCTSVVSATSPRP